MKGKCLNAPRLRQNNSPCGKIYDQNFFEEENSNSQPIELFNYQGIRKQIIE